MLIELQVDLANMVTAAPYFAAEPPLTCLTEALGDIESIIAERLGQLGIAIVVLTPGGRWPNDEADGLDLEPAIVIEVAEIPTLNDTGRRALQCVEQLIVLLHGKTHSTGPGAAATRRLKSANPPFTLVNTPSSRDPALTYHVFFSTDLSLRAADPGAPFVAGEDGIIVAGEDGTPVAGDPET